MNAKKLPSGSWRCRVYSHTESVKNPDGSVKYVKRYKSITVADPSSRGKRECERLAAEFAQNISKQYSSFNLTVAEALDSYLQTKSAVLSPSTLTGYRRMLPKFSALANLPLHSLTYKKVQSFVNGLAKEYSPKYVANIYGLLHAALDMHGSAFDNISLPQKPRNELYLPTDNDISTLIAYCKEHDQVLLRAVYLGAFGTMRRSEICGLDVSDCDPVNLQVHVRNVLVVTDSGCVLKNTAKNYTSQRIINLPDFFFNCLPESGKIVPLHPDALSKRFRVALYRAGIPHFRFHDLRHYAVSIMHALKIPDQYIQDQGGWRSNYTMNRVYRQIMPEYARKYNDALSAHFGTLNGTDQI